MDNQTENLLMQQMGILIGKMSTIEKAVMGNGQPGLAQRVEDLEGFRKAVWGALAVLTSIGGFLEWLVRLRRH